MSSDPAPTSRDASSSSNPNPLPPRYEIRRLQAHEVEWAWAIICHSNYWHSPICSIVHADSRTKDLDAAMAEECLYWPKHAIASGWSYGVFDLEYKFKRAESEATGGKLYFDLSNGNATSEQLLEQMDFPLVSVALAHDGANPMGAEVAPFLKLVPDLTHTGLANGARDQRDPSTWKPTGPGQVLMRAATSTREEYEGKGLMSGLARWMMREAKLKGFRGIQIGCMNDAVNHVWTNPPAPFKATIPAEFNTWEYDGKDESGQNPFKSSRQRVTRVYVEL